MLKKGQAWLDDPYEMAEKIFNFLELGELRGLKEMLADAIYSGALGLGLPLEGNVKKDSMHIANKIHSCIYGRQNGQA